MVENFYSYIVDCKWNDWVNGTCSMSCGGGFRNDTRTEKNPASNGGVPCEGDPSIIEICNNQECPGQENFISIMFY